jgi:ABC-2 type transport system ATP-binding protein
VSWRASTDDVSSREAPAASLRASGLSKWYGQVIGLNDVSVAVAPGVTGLLGPNGAGKSTLLKLATGQLRPSKGTIEVLGGAPWGSPALFRRVGYCPEQDAFYDTMTGAEWVTALLRLSGFDGRAARQKALAALEVMGLVEAAGRRIGGYSKGMRQRAKMAQAIAHDPELLILDEPLAGMDPVGRRLAIQGIRAWGEAGKTVVVSSHVLHEVERMTSDVLLIHNGRILAEGNVRHIRELIDDHPHTIHVRAEAPRRLARHLLDDEGLLSLRFEDGALVAQTARPDTFYAHLTALAASGEAGDVEEVTSPDDNLEAVFRYLVK